MPIVFFIAIVSFGTSFYDMEFWTYICFAKIEETLIFKKYVRFMVLKIPLLKSIIKNNRR